MCDVISLGPLTLYYHTHPTDEEINHVCPELIYYKDITQKDIDNIGIIKYDDHYIVFYHGVFYDSSNGSKDLFELLDKSLKYTVDIIGT